MMKNAGPIKCFFGNLLYKCKTEWKWFIGDLVCAIFVMLVVEFIFFIILPFFCP